MSAAEYCEHSTTREHLESISCFVGRFDDGAFDYYFDRHMVELGRVLLPDCVRPRIAISNSPRPWAPEFLEALKIQTIIH